MKRAAIVLAALLVIGYAAVLHRADDPKPASKVALCPSGLRPLFIDSGRDENGVLQFIYVCDTVKK